MPLTDCRHLCFKNRPWNGGSMLLRGVANCQPN